MFTRQKVATISGLVGSLAVICAGAAHANADEPRSDCRSTVTGGVVCIRKSEIRTNEHGKRAIKQTQDCSTADRPRVVFPDGRMLDGGSAKVGPVVDCSNNVKLPKGFKRPHFDKARFGF
ncbi:hypothetical protein BFF78_27010 [Streptomyces fodineus]|uniref:Secreted protein n=1 Tax=Streptomyces fodineus TaxID=1904616 RepID=A0A1D7YF22_9ACTN|nr:hypothetical protein [Streptomyces fodineus]AOR34218.1 hypothetical protein BFF78_27010 [Streptomyces fodineus]